MSKKINKRMSGVILQSMSAGVVPRIGTEYIAVGRKEEVSALLDDLDNRVSEGGAAFRLLLGGYGTGKSFLVQLIRNYAVQRNFVVADADLTPEHRLTGTKGQGLALYRELLNNMATRARPDGGAFASVLEHWISEVQTEVVNQDGIQPNARGFSSRVEARIYQTVNQIEGMVHGFDFGAVITAYWQGHQDGDDTRKEAALRWLRGEYNTKTEAKEALGVRVIVDDSNWYDYIKLLAGFVKQIGYKGLVIFLDEGVNLYKISNTVARNNNYERLLSIFNDTLQGKAAYLGMILCGTPQMVEDRQRGLFSYDALRTRLEQSRFAREGLRDLSGPMISLNTLMPEEMFVLLLRLREVHGAQHNYTPAITDEQIKAFMVAVRKKLGAEAKLTPRELAKDFIYVLNILHHHPDQTLETILGADFTPSKQTYDPDTLTPETEINDTDNSPYKGFEV